MAVINKNIVAVFGRGIFNRAVSALDFDSQNIPSELYDKFRAVCGLARPLGTTQRRYPWRINQPGTPQQLDVWEKFLYCTSCFEEQTLEQREEWYNQSIGSGLFYYTYFMSQTLPIVHQGLLPGWCFALFYEPFHGTELDLAKWLEPIITHDPPHTLGTYWVDERFYSRHFGYEFIVETILKTREFRTPVSFDKSFDLSLSWGVRGLLDSTVLMFSLVSQVDIGLATGWLPGVEPFPYPHLCAVVRFFPDDWIRLTGPLVPGQSYRFRVKYDGATEHLEIYLDGDLIFATDKFLESNKLLQYRHWTDFLGGLDPTFVIGTIDDITVHTLEE